MSHAKQIETAYGLSPMQQGMLFHSLQAPGAGVYVEQLRCTLSGDLNVGAFEKAWQTVVDRHAILRTGFVWKRLEKMLQAVYRQVDLHIQVDDWRDHAKEDDLLERFQQSIAAERSVDFDFSKPPLMRLRLIRTSEDRHEFVWTHHHILLDGWSLPLVLDEVLECYDAFRQQQIPPSRYARPYADYIRWLKRQNPAKADTFWAKYLEGYVEPATIRPDKESDGVVSVRTCSTTLSKEVSESLRKLARQNGVTLSTVVQCAWALLLSRYAGTADVVFGLTVSGRPPDLPGAESMVGLFINTLPARVQISANATVSDLLKSVQRRQAELRPYEWTPLVDIQKSSQVPAGAPLFDTIVVFENYPADPRKWNQRAGLTVENIRAVEQTNYLLTFVSAPEAELPLKLIFDPGRFEDTTIMRMLDHLRTILGAMESNPQKRIWELEWLPNAEIQQVAVEWSGTEAEYPNGKCAHELFGERAAKHPDAVAVEFEGERLTYSEVDRRANQLARYLGNLGVGPEVLVGICLERSPEMLVAILAVMKAGGAYVPLDPRYPADRLNYMLADCNAAVLLTDERSGEVVRAQDCRVVRIDAERRRISEENDAPIENITVPANLAYVIYTSGSTGKPKGTLLTHRGLVNLAITQSRELDVTDGSRVLQFAAFGFDASVSEIFVTLLQGATLCLVPQDRLASIDQLKEVLKQQRITTATLPPSVLTLLSPEGLEDLAAVISAGEPCSEQVVKRWAPGRQMFNGYGPTETTVCASMARCSASDQGMPAIGRALSNCKTYVLDDHLVPVAVGVAGELHIGGAGLARGYLHRPELTAEKFIPDPIGKEAGARLYRSGDRVRWREDGQLEFLGRVDDQVKVRGYRIELGEIETVLRQAPGVCDCAVTLRDNSGGPQIVAYIVSSGSSDLQSWREHLQSRLPSYMVPAMFVPVTSLPKSPNGKIDRRKLPSPESVVVPKSDLRPPRTETEQVIAGIWSQVLGVDGIAPDDNFFELGGHSLSVTQVSWRIKDAFGVDIPISEIFKRANLSELAAVVDETRRRMAGVAVPTIERADRGRDMAVSFAQQRLWFLDQLAPGSALYSTPSAVRLVGDLDIGALRNAIQHVVDRHESLRTVFHDVGGRPVQVILPELAIETTVEDLRFCEGDAVAEARRRVQDESQRPFDLGHGPLLRAAVWRVGEQDHILLINVHHIVSDGWSTTILIRELAQAYTAIHENRLPQLADLPVQYADYAAWQRAWLSGDPLARQVAYWKTQLAGLPKLLQLPTDRPRPPVQTFRGAHWAMEIPLDVLHGLRRLGRKQGSTLFMSLAAGFAGVLSRYTGQTDIAIGTPVANRNRPELDRLIGFFVNTLVLRTCLDNDPSFYDLVSQVREQALAAYANQDVPFEMVVEAVAPERDLSHSPLFQVMLVLNQERPAIKLPSVEMQPLESETGIARFELTVEVTERSDGLFVSAEYNVDLFDESTVARLMQSWKTLLSAAVNDPDRRISELPVMSSVERDEILTGWNETTAPCEHALCAHHLFERHATERPETIALSFEGRAMSYGELNRRANDVARHLRAAGVGPDVLAGVSFERSLELVVAILAVLKAGGAYLPLDPQYPAERLRFMAEDSGISILVTQGEKTWCPRQVQVIGIQTDSAANFDDDALERVHVGPDNLAYVIYTSGSTGRPKGTMLSHRGLVNLAATQQKAFAMGGDKRVLQFAPIGFDASVWEIFMALANGASLCMATQDKLASHEELERLLRDERITTATLPPSMLRLLAPDRLSELKTVVVAGEACPEGLAKSWAPGRQFVNAYGPTETTVCASMAEYGGHQCGTPPIGRPLPNFRLYVLDQHCKPVPIGVNGELWIGGPGLARGYLNRRDLTAERFRPDPFSKRPGERLYRTGDLVRWRVDGHLEFVGRLDEQVKVRGFRIELGEVEAILQGNKGVADAAVIAGEDPGGGKRLIAYVVSENSESVIDRLRWALREQLPEYMIPTAWVEVATLPRLPSGKIDRNSLPAPNGSVHGSSGYVPPRTEHEVKIAAIWAGLLNVNQIGAHDNFFELGGHSLLATQAVSRIRKELNVDLRLMSLFEHPTVASLAEHLQGFAHQRIEQDILASVVASVSELSEAEAMAMLHESTSAKAAGNE